MRDERSPSIHTPGAGQRAGQRDEELREDVPGSLFVVDRRRDARLDAAVTGGTKARERVSPAERLSSQAMSEAREYRRTLSDLRRGSISSGAIFDLASRRERVAELQSKSVAPDFWNDNERARAVLADLKQHQQWVEGYDVSRRSFVTPTRWPSPGGRGRAARRRIRRLGGRTHRAGRALRVPGMLREADDFRGAILTIHPGAGGTELDQDDAAAHVHQMDGKERVHLSDRRHPGREEAGITRVTVEVEGDYSFGYLKPARRAPSRADQPVRRERQATYSFASVFVYPDIADEITVEIQDKDLKVDTYRASGAEDST